MYKKIFTNSVWLYIANIIVKAIALFYNVFLARVLGVENFGLYTLALSYFVLLAAVSDFGIARFLIREGAKNRKNINLFFSTVLTLRVFLTVTVFVIFTIGLYLFDPSESRVLLILLALLALMPQSIGVTFDNVFISLQKIKISAIGVVITSISTTSAGIFLILSGYGVTSAIMALLFGEMVHAVFLMLLFAKEKGLVESYIFQLRLAKEVLKNSLPFGLLSILGLVYFRVDTLLLSYISGSYDTGIYAAAYKFLEALVFVPSSLAVVVFPLMVQLQDKSNIELKSLSKRIFWVMGGIGVVFSVSFVTILPTFIQVFLPDYVLSIKAVRVLALAIPFMFIHIPLAQVLTSSDKYLKHLLVISFFPLIFNVVMNLIFIPKYGFMAASWITVASDILSLAVLICVLVKYFFNQRL